MNKYTVIRNSDCCKVIDIVCTYVIHDPGFIVFKDNDIVIAEFNDRDFSYYRSDLSQEYA